MSSKRVGSNNQSLVEFTQNVADLANNPNIYPNNEHYLVLSGPISMSSHKNSNRSRTKNSRSGSQSSKGRRNNIMSTEQMRKVQKLDSSKAKSFATDEDSSNYSSSSSDAKKKKLG